MLESVENKYFIYLYKNLRDHRNRLCGATRLTEGRGATNQAAGCVGQPGQLWWGIWGDQVGRGQLGGNHASRGRIGAIRQAGR